jgi:uncharacterized SAM-binding protein YcdF (DUF218 family)
VFALRKLIEWLLTPSTVVVLTLLAGCLVQWHERFRRAGRLIASTGAVMLLLLWCGIPFNAIARLLETRYQPILSPTRIATVSWIVVLGAGHRSESALPLSSRPDAAGLSRTLEGLRLQNAMPGSRLLLSGGAVFDSVSDARIKRDLARSLGVPNDVMRIDERARSTAEEADALRGTVGEAPFLLVTSALHMPRAMILFRGRSMHPIPAPTDYQSPHSLVPTAGHIELADATAHELLGLAWAWLRSVRFE